MDNGAAGPVLQPEMAGICTENNASLVNIKNSSEINIFNSLAVKLNSGMPVATFGSAGRIVVQLKEKPSTIKIEMYTASTVEFHLFIPDVCSHSHI